MLRFGFGPALIAAVLTSPAMAQSGSQREYIVSIGAASERVASGKMWLFSFSWYGLQRIELATVENGRATVPLDTMRLRRELDPHPNTDGYVVALQAGERLWFRTPDISPDVVWREWPSALNSLGLATALSSGETQVIVPRPAKRHITLLYPDGRAAANVNIPVSIYLWDRNHCGFHEGLELGSFRTDKSGAIEVLAPLTPLYLGVSYYAEAGAGPAGPAYSDNHGLKTGPEENLALKEGWQFSEKDARVFGATLRVVSTEGRPKKDVRIWMNWKTNTCGGGQEVGRTDSKGAATIGLDPSVVGLQLQIGGPYSWDDPRAKDNTRDLTAGELRELVLKHKVTIRW
ncbi:MAG TPA: hypothetical protein VH639_04170 [Bryobacteraceae bacterium]